MQQINNKQLKRHHQQTAKTTVTNKQTIGTERLTARTLRICTLYLEKENKCMMIYFRVRWLTFCLSWLP